MLQNANFLCEIGTEEIPASYIPPMIQTMEGVFKQKLTENRIDYGEIEAYATPRRLVILISDMNSMQREEEIEIKGPPVKAAYDADNQPTKALTGFLKANDSTSDDVIIKKMEKGEYVFINKRMKAKETIEILPYIIEFFINNISTPKKMKWSDISISFPRPISYFMILLNNKIVPLNISGITSGNRTKGHYIQFNKNIEIEEIRDYESLLNKNGVIINHGQRKEFIRKGLDEAAENIGGVLVEDDELLDTVTFLTEYPFIVSCEFDKEFLLIPDVVLISEMREHQKYFALRDKNGSLLSTFLVVSNNPLTEFIKKGNERVLRARFNDAEFFFNEDRKTSLYQKVESLKSVLFHKDLGTIYDKIKRMSNIADNICIKLKVDEITAKKIDRAIHLCKADLQTTLVFEFPSLQGEIGRIYALLDGEDEDVADAINNHYKPRFFGDELPVNIVSIVVSLSEKLDNIFGSFSVGNIPKGSEDPYALRRQANAVLEILISNEINLNLDDVLNEISTKYKNGAELIGKILDFFSARAKTIFQEKGYRYDEIDACLSIGNYDFFELCKRAKSLHGFRSSGNFSEMLLSFKRMNNILSLFIQKNPNYGLQFVPEILKERSEKDLFNFFEIKKSEIDEYIDTNQYDKLFNLLTEARTIIDIFFDNVIVMSEDISERDNRLALLDKILTPFKNILDFSKISE